MNKDKLNTWKQKLADNAGDIAFWGVIGASVVGYIGIVGYAIKKQSDLLEGEAARTHELTMQSETLKSEALARGAQVLPKGDGTYWIIEKDGRVA